MPSQTTVLSINLSTWDLSVLLVIILLISSDYLAIPTLPTLPKLPTLPPLPAAPQIFGRILDLLPPSYQQRLMGPYKHFLTAILYLQRLWNKAYGVYYSAFRPALTPIGRREFPNAKNVLLFAPCAPGSRRPQCLPMLLAKLGTATPPINLRVILTHTEMTLHDYTPLNIQLYCDSDPDTTLAFRLRDWADMLIVHGMDSDTLAAIATGWSGESLGRKVVRCWYYGEDRRGGKMLYVQPMMEDGEWRHPVTRRQLEVLLGWEGGIVMGKNCGDEEKAARDCVVAVRTYGEVPKP